MSQGALFDLFRWISGNLNSFYLLVSLFSTAVILFVVFPVHECAHALAAKLLGDDTAERQGRLTLNPFAHLDLIGTFMILLFRVGWAKPVPVNPGRCRKVSARAASVITALAGPLSNIIMAYIFLIIAKLILFNAEVVSTTAGYATMAVFYVAQINLFLAVFNLIPIPPLDGHYVLFYFLKPQWEYHIRKYQHIITMVFFMLIFATNLFSYIIVPASNAIMNGLDFLSGFAGRLAGMGLW